MATLMFGGAGTLAWRHGWVFLIVYFAWTIGGSIWLFRHDPTLFERGADTHAMDIGLLHKSRTQKTEAPSET